MSVLLTQGTIEYVPVDIEDRSGLVTDVTGSTPTFTVLDDADVALYTDEPAIGAGMRINCLFNTSATHPGGLWDIGHYRLFVKFVSGAQTPILPVIDVYIYDGS